MSTLRSSGGGSRSPWLSAIGILLGMVLLFGAGFGVAWFLSHRSNDSAVEADASSPTPLPCTTVTVVPGNGLPKPGQVATNVFNATNRAGLAAKTAKELKARGFKVGKIANDPLNKTLTGVAEIRYGPAGAQAAQLMKYYIVNATLVNDKRKDATIDTVLGEKFTVVAPAAAVQAALASPVPSLSGPGCTPSEKPAPSGSAAPSVSPSAAVSESASPAAS